MIYLIRQWREGQAAGLVTHLERHGLAYGIIEAYDNPVWPQLATGDAIFGLGGPAGVADLRATHYEHLFLLDEERFIDEARRCGVPFMGICLAHQLLARMEDHDVDSGPHTVFGIQPVELTRAGREHWLFDGVPPQLMFYQNHRDYVVSLPASAQLLASSPTCAVESAAWDDLTVSTQFHPEVLATQVPVAIARFPRQLAHSGLTLEQMLARVPMDYQMYTERVFDNFLYRAGAITSPQWKQRTLFPVQHSVSFASAA